MKRSNKNLPRYMFFFLLSTLYCCKNDKNNKILLEVGGYKISHEKFNDALQNSNFSKELSVHEKEILLLDNFISAGLIIETAKKQGYLKKLAYTTEYNTFKNDLYVKYSKLNKLNIKSIEANYNSNSNLIHHSNSVIDYVWVPINQEDIAIQILDRLKSGGDIKDLLQSPSFEKWDKLNLRFYQKINTSTSLLTEKNLENVSYMKKDEAKIFQSTSGYYVVKLIKSAQKDNSFQNVKSQIFNSLIADAIDNGNVIFDQYTLNKSIKIDEKLLSEFQFEIKPLNKTHHALNKNNKIAEYLGKDFYVNEIYKDIALLPPNIQAYFRNNSTRIKAVANLILYSNSDLLRSVLYQNELKRQYFQKQIENSLIGHHINDTTSFFVNFIEKELSKPTSNLFTQILLNNTGDESKVQIDSKLFFNELNNFSWITNDYLPGKQYLRLNFEKIKDMKIPEGPAPKDNQILASYKEWKLSIPDFYNELDKLTPESRILLSQNNNVERAVLYFSEKAGISNPKLIKINRDLLNKIDVIGNSFDLLNNFQKNPIVGSIGNIQIKEEAVLNLVASLSDSRRDEYLNDIANRKVAFTRLLEDIFWQQQFKKEVLDKNTNLKNELKEYENWLICNSFYESEICLHPLNLPNEKVDLYFKVACKIVCQNRLTNTLLRAGHSNNIKINHRLIKELGIKISLSKYYNLIKNKYDIS